MEGLEATLQETLRELAKFQGLQSDYRVLYGKIKSLLANYDSAIAKARVCTATAHQANLHYQTYLEFQREFNKTAVNVLQRLRAEQKQHDRRELLHHRAAMSPGDPNGNPNDNPSADPSGSLGNEITHSLQRMIKTMQDEIAKSSLNYELMDQSSRRLLATHGHYQGFARIVDRSRSLIRDLWRKERTDQFYILAALSFLFVAVIYIVLKRLWLAPLAVPVRWIASHAFPGGGDDDNPVDAL